MQLIGIQIKVGDVEKFIGKVGIAPKGAPKEIAGHAIFYREARFDDAFSHGTNSIGFDVAATDKAAELGAVYVVSYHVDKRAMSVASIGDLTGAAMVDLGERLQYRLALGKWATYDGRKIRMGYTKNVVDVEPQRKLPQSGEELRAAGLQRSLFDIGMTARANPYS